MTAYSVQNHHKPRQATDIARVLLLSTVLVMVLMLLLSFVNVVQAQVKRGEQLRAHWHMPAAQLAEFGGNRL